MKTILLLAGQSKRFWPLKEKSLFPIAGKPLIAHIVGQLQKAGCKDIVLVGGKHNIEEVHSLFPKFRVIEQEKLELGMRGALLSSLPSCKKEPVLIVSANDVIDASGYRDTVAAGKKRGIDGALLAQRVTSYFPGGYLSIAKNRITGIVEKPKQGTEPSDLVTIVCHYHRDASVLLKALQSVIASRDDGYEQALDALFASHHYSAVPLKGMWQAVKYPWHMLHVLPLLLNQTKKKIDTSATIHKSAVIEGNVVIEKGVRILPNACIVGPAVIGAHSIIGNNALVRGSSIGKHCVIGYNTEVKGSVLGNHVWTHSTYLGDSVIGGNVSFGAGSVTGNLRLDEAEIASMHGEKKIPTGLNKFGSVIGNNSRIGIHVSMHPGVKIGSNCFVASSALVDRDVPDDSFVKMTNGEMHVRKNSAAVQSADAREVFRKKL